MLVLSRKVDETIVVADKVFITLLEIRGRLIRLGVKAPPIIPVDRYEVHVSKTRPLPILQRNGDLTILKFTGHEYDESSSMFGQSSLQNELHDHFATRGHFMLDFINIFKLNSNEVAILVSLDVAMISNGGQLTLFNLFPAVRHLLQRSTKLSLCA